MGVKHRSVTSLTGPGQTVNHAAAQRGIREHALHHQNVTAAHAKGEAAVAAERRVTRRAAFLMLFLLLCGLSLVLTPV